MKKSFFSLLLCLVIFLPVLTQTQKSSKIKNMVKGAGYSAVFIGGYSNFLFTCALIYLAEIKNNADFNTFISQHKHPKITRYGIWGMLSFSLCSSSYAIYKSFLKLKQLLFFKNKKNFLENDFEENYTVTQAT